MTQKLIDEIRARCEASRPPYSNNVIFMEHARDDISRLLEYIEQLKSDKNTLVDNLSHLICKTGEKPSDIKCIWEKRTEELQSENAELRTRLDKAVELPCEVGDTIYFLSKNLKKIIPHEIVSYYCRPNKISFECNSVSIIKNSCFAFSCCDISKTVFLTREEAEKALKERETK